MKKSCFAAATFLLMIASSGSAQFLGQQSLAQSSYVIDKNGNLFTWGWNAYGQLGVGDKIDRNTPQQVPVPSGATNWTMVAGGARHALGLADSDKLYAWGSNRYGQLGTGTLGEVVIPVRVPNPPGVTAWKWISAGEDHSVALSSSGQLYAWGNNENGQLGTGTRIVSTSPMPVLKANGVSVWGAVAAGPGYTIAISSGGQLFGWGTDSIGSCDQAAPVIASDHGYRALTPLMDLGASNEHECSIGTDGHFADGNNEPGDSSQYASVADGGFHYLALKTRGNIYASGQNNHGQLGLGDTISRFNEIPEYPENALALPTGVTQFVGIAGGLYHSLALGNDGWLYAWGDNTHGELGTGSRADQWKPVRVLMVGDPLRISASLTAPSLVGGLPFEVNLHVSNASNTVTLTNAQGSMVPSAYLYLKDSQQQEPLIPGTLVPLTSDSASWQFIATQYVQYNAIYPYVAFPYFAFVRATGSAPQLVTSAIDVISKPVHEQLRAQILDSLTMKPVPNVEVTLEGPEATTFSDSSGNFSFLLTEASTYTLIVMKENYTSNYSSFTAPTDGDTVAPILLAPAPIIGHFTPVPGMDPSMGITAFYYPDSLIGYAIGGRTIWRTMDSGAHWNAIYTTTSNNTLRDIRFVNVRMGIAVGDSGEIVTTSDSGKTWTEVPPVTIQNLNAVAYSARDTVWACGDSSTLLKGVGNQWSRIGFQTTSPFKAIHFFDADHGIVVGHGPYFFGYDLFAWHPTFTGLFNDYRTVYYASPNHIYIGGYATNIFDVFDHSSHLLFGQKSNSLYFLNEQIGFSAGPYLNGQVTYDASYTWAWMDDYKDTAQSQVNFFSLNGSMLIGGRMYRFNGHPNSISAIVRGRVISGDRETGIRGAMIARKLALKNGITVNTAYTNELGNFVFAGIADTFHYDYRLTYVDSGIIKTYAWASVSAKPGQIVTLNFMDAPPLDTTTKPPDTTKADIGQASPLALHLTVERSNDGNLRALFTMGRSEAVTLALYDVMGREVEQLLTGEQSAGDHLIPIETEELVNGNYFLRAECASGSLIVPIIIAH